MQRALASKYQFMVPLATNHLLENIDGVLRQCSLGVAACCPLTMLTRAILMTSSHSEGLDWMVEYVFQDLLDWNNWFITARTLPIGVNQTSASDESQCCVIDSDSYES